MFTEKIMHITTSHVFKHGMSQVRTEFRYTHSLVIVATAYVTLVMFTVCMYTAVFICADF